MNIQIAGIHVDVPDDSDPETVNRAARIVEERIKQAEDASSRIDTLAFALSAAHSLAIELQATEAARQTDAEATARALARIAAELESLTELGDSEDD